MLNQSSQNDSYLCKMDSDELIMQKKYSRKSKMIKKKSHEMGVLGNQKKKCPNFDKGTCTFGAMCNNSHSFIPDIAKKQCKNFSINLCKKGEFCPFSHNLQRFPCKELHIVGNCSKIKNCPFSHRQLDPDFYQDFFEDNLDFISQALEKGKHLSPSCLQFTNKIDINSKIKKKLELEDQHRFPIFYGISVTRSASIKGSGHQEQLKPKTLVNNLSKKQQKNQKPFSIRLACKNRLPIPEQLFIPLSIFEAGKEGENLMKPKLSWEQKQQQYANMDNLISQKISHEIDLTPEERVYNIDRNPNFQFQQFLS